MSARIEVPLSPRPPEPRGPHIEPPWVPVAPRWEYKALMRDLESEELPSERELDGLGADGWELAGVAHEGQKVHFYFKRERTR
jgi:hypothetical protein